MISPFLFNMKNNNYILFLGIIILCGLMLGFISADQYQLKIPRGFPQPNIPENNQLTKSGVELGRKLFFDPILSRDTTVSCATCHQPERAFTDGLRFSKGIRGQFVDRNAPTLTNVVYQDSGILHDAGVPTLEMQVLVPVQEHKEFDFNLILIAERLKKNAEYVQLSQKGYRSEITPAVITKAIASFERTLISGNSRYDQFINGNKTALSKSEQVGMSLFFNKLRCAECHSGFNFTNLTLQNNGIAVGPYALDSGRMRITHLEKDRDLFKVPTLRNIEVTAPYMHNGSMKTLEDVIENYNQGGNVHTHKSNLIKPLNLSDTDKKDLKNFLLSLTDKEFLQRKY